MSLPQAKDLPLFRFVNHERLQNGAGGGQVSQSFVRHGDRVALIIRKEPRGRALHLLIHLLANPHL